MTERRGWHRWTPACAGEPLSSSFWAASSWVDPRLRGGADMAAKKRSAHAGGPPPARGSRAEHFGHDVARGWTPACAGEPSPALAARSASWVDPRLRGGAPLAEGECMCTWGGPPPARGSRHASWTPDAKRGWTPACAGEPPSEGGPRIEAGVDPRLRGGAAASRRVNLS